MLEVGMYVRQTRKFRVAFALHAIIVVAIVVAKVSPPGNTSTPSFSLKSPENPWRSVTPCQGSMQMKCAPGFVQMPR